MSLPDISSWYTPRRAADEEVNWLLSGHHRKHLAFMLPLVAEMGVQSMYEFGCGCGILARELPSDILYTGIDKNGSFIDKANLLCHQPRQNFLCWCIRNFRAQKRDLSCAFNFQKHFGLGEWGSILGIVLEHGKHACFNLQLSLSALDDGKEFHHAFVTEDVLAAALESWGHVEVRREVLSAWTLEYGRPCSDVIIWTSKVVEESPAEQIVEAVSTEEQPRRDAGMAKLYVGGKLVADEDRHHYAVRWLTGDQEWTLYYNGRRVTAGWSLEACIEQGEDTAGASANTA